MSDTLDNLRLRQRQIQQRQILAMMGVDQWVSPSSPTINIANIMSLAANEVTQSDTVNSFEEEMAVEVISNKSPTLSNDSTTLDNDEELLNNASVTTEQNPVSMVSDNPNPNNPNSPNSPNNVYNFDNASVSSVAVSETIDSTESNTTATASIKQDVSADADILNNHSMDKIAPFDLQGGRYGNYVLIVDIQALNNDSQKLWQNITRALSLDLETSSFPICEGMDTVELANASLAGYIFKIGRSEEVKVVALTELPTGLSHTNFTSTVTLDKMLADSSLKKQFWQQISS